MRTKVFVVVVCVLAWAMAGTAAQDGRWSSKGPRRAGAPRTADRRDAAQGDEGTWRAGLAGTWRSTESFADGSTFNVLFSFTGSRNVSAGTVVHSDELFFTGSPSCLTAQGVWARSGERAFVATDEGFCFETFNGFVPAGKIKFKSALTLDKSGNAFEGTMHVEGYDVDGNLVFSDDAKLHGTRMLPEAP